MTGASIEAMLEPWVPPLREVKARMQTLFSQTRASVSGKRGLHAALSVQP